MTIHNLLNPPRQDSVYAQRKAMTDAEMLAHEYQLLNKPWKNYYQTGVPDYYYRTTTHTGADPATIPNRGIPSWVSGDRVNEAPPEVPGQATKDEADHIRSLVAAGLYGQARAAGINIRRRMAAEELCPQTTSMGVVEMMGFKYKSSRVLHDKREDVLALRSPRCKYKTIPIEEALCECGTVLHVRCPDQLKHPMPKSLADRVAELMKLDIFDYFVCVAPRELFNAPQPLDPVLLGVIVDSGNVKNSTFHFIGKWD